MMICFTHMPPVASTTVKYLTIFWESNEARKKFEAVNVRLSESGSFRELFN